MSIPWPSGYRAAVCLTWDVDGESALYVRYPERAKSLLGELHQRAYGPQVGIWRVLRLLEHYGVPGTFFIPSFTASRYADALRAIVTAGHPIGLHGHLHETLETLDEEQETEVLRRSQRILEHLAGYRPAIYRAPSWELNRRTPELLVKHGVRSDSSLMDDEAPYALQTPSGPLIEIPIHWLLDDVEYWMHSRVNRDKSFDDPDTVLKFWSREFDGYYQDGGCYVLTLHPLVSGRYVFMDVIERLVQYIKGFPGIWWATMPQITDHALRLLGEGALDVRTSPEAEPSP